MIKTFEDLQISEQVLRALSEMGFEEPTPIQKEAIPVAKAGGDMIGQAQTGTGKTAAFGIPAIDSIDPEVRKPQVLILSPTRELAIQVAEELNKMAQYAKVKALPIYGGQDIQRQFRRLRSNPQIIVATPGRLMDHMNRGSITFEGVRMVVLDEADEMLNMGFVEDINKILAAVPEENRQTLLFSATMPRAIRDLAEQYLTEPQIIRMKPTQVTMDLIEQYYIEVQDRQKFDIFCRLLDMHSPELAIVFGRTKRRVDEVTEGLKKRGYTAEGIHGDLSQSKRDSVIRQFREGTIDILVATDVAARGLDVSGVTHVYNFDLPQDPESYVHRVGRTGRAGNAGQAMTFVIPREMEHLHAIERLTKRKITRRKAPSLSEVLEGQQKLAVQSIIELVEANSAEAAEYRASAEELLGNYDSVALVSAAIKLLTKEPDTTPVKITEEAPLRVRGSRRRFNRDGRRGDRRGGGRRDGRRGDRRNRSERGDRNDRRDRNDRSDRNERGEGRRGDRNRDNGRRNDRNNRGGNRRNDRRNDNRNNEQRQSNSSFKPYFKD